MFNQRNIRFINHSHDIQPERYVNDSKIHFNRYGTIVLLKKLQNFCQIYIEAAVMIVVLGVS